MKRSHLQSNPVRSLGLELCRVKSYAPQRHEIFSQVEKLSTRIIHECGYFSRDNLIYLMKISIVPNHHATPEPYKAYHICSILKDRTKCFEYVLIEHLFGY